MNEYSFFKDEIHITLESPSKQVSHEWPYVEDKGNAIFLPFLPAPFNNLELPCFSFCTLRVITAQNKTQGAFWEYFPYSLVFYTWRT